MNIIFFSFLLDGHDNIKKMHGQKKDLSHLLFHDFFFYYQM